MENFEKKQSKQNSEKVSPPGNSPTPAAAGFGNDPGETAKFINSRMHDYARDSLQRFAILFSLGSVAVSILFLGSIQLFLQFPISRLCSENCAGGPLIGKIVLGLWISALACFFLSICCIYNVFAILHCMDDSPDTPSNISNEKHACVDRTKSNKKTRDSLRKRLNRKFQERQGRIAKQIWGKLKLELNLIPKENPNFLRTVDVAGFEDHQVLYDKYAKLFPSYNWENLSAIVRDVLEDVCRIVRRILIIDHYYFKRALFWLVMSLVFISIVNSIFIFWAIKYPSAQTHTLGVRSMTRHIVKVKGRDIFLDVHYPTKQQKGKNSSALIIVPGGRGKNYVIDPNTGVCFTGYDDLASELTKRGFYTVVFDGRGQGQSEGLRSHQNGLIDLQKVIKFACKFPEVNPEGVGVFGRCGGAAIALRLAVKDRRIKSVMTWGMPPCFDELGRRKIEQRLLQAGVRLKKGAAFLNGEDAALNVKQPLFVAGGTEDTNWFFIDGKVDRQLDMIEAISKKGISSKVRFEILSGASHEIDSKHKCFEQFVDLVSEWFKETLK